MSIPRLAWNHPRTVARLLTRCHPMPESSCVALGPNVWATNWQYVKVFGFPGCPSNVVLAHRYFFAVLRDVRFIREGIDLDHTCRRRGCINVYHLDPVAHDLHGAISQRDQMGDPFSRILDGLPDLDEVPF